MARSTVRMLRRAMDFGGFHQVIFICHSGVEGEGLLHQRAARDADRWE